ncbi:tryptophan--tRNA ligase, partial [Candidatus Microgenomates bacterium]|nr:tryptophan--tRNA ligase [Candidatus Microgenomates bacterium]
VSDYSQQLKKLGIEHQMLEHPQLISVEEVQKYLGFGMVDAGSVLLMKADDKFIAIMRRGDTKLDNEKVKRLLGVTSLKMATEEEFEKITRAIVGAGPVYMPGINLYIDKKIFDKEYINAGSGSLLVTIRYKTEDLRKIPGIEVVDFTSKETEKTEIKKEAYPKFEETVKALKEKNTSYELIKHPSIKTVEEGLAFLGIGPDQGVSSLIFETEKGLVAVLRRDDHQVDIEKVKHVLEVNRIRLCKPAEVLNISGCEVGYVSPYNPGFPIVMDETILEQEVVYTGSGSPYYDLKISPRNLKVFTQAKAADVIGKGIVRAKSRILSGITPSGECSLHIANYLGAVKQFVQLAKSYDCYLFVADLHALTTVQNEKQLQHNVETVILNELALLGDLTNITFFRQSDVPQHVELAVILNNFAPLGLLKRAHAYKDKLQKEVKEEDVNMGLFSYPVLMAADILMYKPDFVPVGKDQKQHIEIARDLAERFNKTYKRKVFPLPKPYIPEDVAVIMGTDGKRKMSKSLGNIISIFEDENVIKKQVMGAYTDPTRIHADDPGHIEGNMVFTYLDFFGNKEKVTQLKELYKAGKVPDVEVKNYHFDSLMKYFAPARERYLEYKNHPEKVKKILQTGAEKARVVASQTMEEVREVVGLTNQYSFFHY